MTFVADDAALYQGTAAFRRS